MKPIPLLGIGTKSQSKNSTAQQRVNCYIAQSDDKSKAVAYGTPGLTQYADFGAQPNRGLYALGDYYYVVNQANVFRVNNAGIKENIGSLFTSAGAVDIADNGLELIIVDGSFGYTYNLTTGIFANISDSDYQPSSTVAFGDSFFITIRNNSGQFFLSSSYDGSTWDALDFATAESSPDNLVRDYYDHGILILFGTGTTEFQAASGSPSFPYSRIGTPAEYGLAARWSVAKLKDSVVWLSKNKLGRVQVVLLQGYTPLQISTDDIETIFNQYDNVADATAFSYLHHGHQFYQINFTSANESWLYDATMNVWSQLKSGAGRHRSEKSVTYFDKILTSDYESGLIYAIDENNYTDNGVPITMELVSKHTHANWDRLSIQYLQAEVEPGNGGNIILQISRDGGHTWGTEKIKSMGVIGEYSTLVRWPRLGQAKNWTFKLKISDPVKRAILGLFVYGT